MPPVLSPPPPAAGPRNPAARLALAFGALSFVGGVTGVLGLVAGYLGLRRSSKTGTGYQAAVYGILLSVLGMPVGLYTGDFVVRRLAPRPPAAAADDDDAARQESSNKLTQIGTALKEFDVARGALPLAAVCDDDGKPLLSWRVAILPQLGQNDLFEKFDLTEPWDGPTNKPLLAEMPRVYAGPKDAAAADRGETRYQVFVGTGAVFGLVPPGPDARSEGLSLGGWSINRLIGSPRGAANLILAVEAGDPVPWTKPADLPYAPDGPLPPLKSPYRDDLLVLMGDGRVLAVRGKAAEYEAALKASLNPESTSPATLDP